MTGLPEHNEASPYYFKYIDRIRNGDIAAEIEKQLEGTLAFLRGIGEEKSLHRYAPEKWTIREVLGHLNDTERVFVSRAFWFARGLEGSLPSMDQDISARASRANDRSWASHVEEFRAVRLATIALFRNLPEEAWMRTGIASGNSFTVRALAFVVAGHLAHHRAILEERYV